VGAAPSFLPLTARLASVTVRVSMLELYNERAYDLLSHAEAVAADGKRAEGVRRVEGRQSEQSSQPSPRTAVTEQVWRLVPRHDPPVPPELVPRADDAAVWSEGGLRPRAAAPLRVVDVRAEAGDSVRVVGVSSFACWTPEQVEATWLTEEFEPTAEQTRQADEKIAALAVSGNESAKAATSTPTPRLIRLTTAAVELLTRQASQLISQPILRGSCT
jgi:hypothetical protein